MVFGRTGEDDAALLKQDLWREGPAAWARGRADGMAWVEVSPGGLPSADVVMHIPGVLTLPVKCWSQGCTTDASLVRGALDGMVVRLATKDEGQRRRGSLRR